MKASNACAGSDTGTKNGSSTGISRLPAVRVGYIRDSYLERRTFLGTTPVGFEHLRLENLLDRVPSALSRFGIDVWGRRSWYRYLAIAEDATEVSLVHMFNHVYLGRKPWVVTYEAAVPRWSEKSRLGMRLLAGSRCAGIVAMSNVAHQSQLRAIEAFPRLRPRIEEKLCVLHPPQEVLVSSVDEKPSFGDWIDFVIVGHEFFRKGGREVLKVFGRLIEEGAAIRLSIVSKLLPGDYASRATEADVVQARHLIDRYPKHIRHWSSLPPSAVLELLQKCHVGLLPTYADTYGFSVLEAQAAGCPVISTNVRALPEINNERLGWLIELPLSQASYAPLKTEGERVEVSEMIASGLERAIREIISRPDVIREKGHWSLERIRQMHDPKTHSLLLRDLYQSAMLV